MSAVPASSVDPRLFPAVRQLLLLEGGDEARLQPSQPDGDRQGVSIVTVQQALPEVQTDLSLADHLLALAATHTCFCCGAGMADGGAGSALRCQDCGAETGAIVAA